MPKKAGIVCVILGAVLIGSALLLFAHNRQEDQNAGQEAEKLLAEIEAVIAARTSDESAEAPSRQLDVEWEQDAGRSPEEAPQLPPETPQDETPAADAPAQTPAATPSG